MISLQDVSKSFGNIKAVDSLSFEIGRGEIVGFLGPNGAGKTTTMRMITGFLYPDEGSIVVNGIDIKKDDIGVRKHIGYLPENNPLYRELLVSEFLKLSADLNGIPSEKRDDAIEFAVSSTGIEGVYYRPIQELSKGYRQRVGLAAALIHKPEILILDEPTEGLDPNQRTEVRGLIKELSKDHTILLSTHVMQEVTAVCERIVVIHKGKLVADGGVDELGEMDRERRRLELDIEGKDVLPKLESIDGIEDVEVVSKDDGLLRLVLNVKAETEIRPEISRLVARNGWIIWRLAEQRMSLEEVFKELTKG